MSALGSVRIESLNKENYDTWKLQMEALLIKNDAWGFVSGETLLPAVNADDPGNVRKRESWLTNDKKAKSDIILAIHPSELKQIKGCTTSREVWLKLEGIYQSKGPARKATLLKQLALQRMDSDGDVRSHVRRFFDCVDKLSEMEVEVNPDLLAILLLYSLPSDFDNFRCAIESLDELPSPEALRVKIIEESDARKKDPRDSTQGALFVKRTNRKAGTMGSEKQRDLKFRCHYCKELGHKYRDCKKRLLKTVASAKNVEDVSLCAVENLLGVQEANQTGSDESDGRWCLDSGATSHICNDAQKYTQLNMSRRGKLNLASNTSTDITTEGSVQFKAEIEGVKKNVCLKNVLHVPDLRANLLSVAKITDNCCKVIFSKNCAEIVDAEGQLKLSAERIGNLYFVREDSAEKCQAASEPNSPESLGIWHRRLGHLNIPDRLKAERTKAVIGLNLDPRVTKLECNVCLQGKMTRTAFPKRSLRKSELLELIHSDLCGPMRVESIGKAKYFATFTDDHSRWTEVRFLKSKRETFAAFKQFKQLVENQKAKGIKCLQSDNGGEYMNKEFDDFLKLNGIARRTSVAYNPEQNGLAERKNRTLIEMARCLLIQSGLPPSFWAEAVSTANYLRNRCPTRSLDGRTPFEFWTGETPDVSHLHEFGSNVLVLDRTPGKGKFEQRTKNGIFLGYSDQSKGYRVWLPEEKRTEISRDVRFLTESSKKRSNCYEDFVPEDAECEDQNTEDIKMRTASFNREIDVELLREDNTENIEVPEPVVEILPESEESDMQDENIEVANVPRRGPGRPRKVLTGRPGRPRKQYHERRVPVENSESEESFIAEIPIKEAVSGAEAEDWFRAMASEVRSILKNNTWELVDRPADRTVIGSRMILRNKYAADGTIERRKARIVAQGFAQRPGIHFNQTFAPVARLSSIRTLVAIAANFGMSMKQFDITTAYLNGEIEEEVFMEIPQHTNRALEIIIQTEKVDSEIRKKAESMLRRQEEGDKVCILKKSLYGLRQAGRNWHAKLREVLMKFGLKPSNADSCIYFSGQGEDILLVAVYVDDILVASRKLTDIERLKKHFNCYFELKELGDPKYCLGIEFSRRENTIAMCQQGYIRDVLNRFGMTESNPVSTPLDINVKLSEPEKDPTREEINLPYRELIGSLMYLAVATRPDIAHAVSVLSQFNSRYGSVHWTAAKRVLRYLKGTSTLGLIFKPSKKPVAGYVDADWASCIRDRRSYTGFTFILANGAISWDSKKQRTVALSSTEAEYMSLSEAAKESIFIRRFLGELGFPELASIKVYNDNIGAQRLADNPVFHARSKHIDVRHHFVRDAVANGDVKIEHLPTDRMLADVFTKGLPGPKHQRCVEGLGLGIFLKI